MGVVQFRKWELIINYPWVRILHNLVGPFCSSGLNVPRLPSFQVSQVTVKVASSNTSRLEAYEGFFRLLMKGIFDHYVL